MSAKRDVEYYRQKYRDGWDSDLNGSHDRSCQCKLCVLVTASLDGHNRLLKAIGRAYATPKKRIKITKQGNGK